jgi:hypothetical protein
VWGIDEYGDSFRKLTSRKFYPAYNCAIIPTFQLGGSP